MKKGWWHFLTLAGEKLPIEVELNAHAGIRGLKMPFSRAPYLGCSSTPCELQFVQIDTYHPSRPHAKQTESQPLLPCDCSAMVCESTTQRATQREAKTIRVPCGRNDKIPRQAFSFHTEVRHVPVEPGMRIVGKLRGEVVDSCKWSTCQTR